MRKRLIIFMFVLLVSSSAWSLSSKPQSLKRLPQLTEKNDMRDFFSSESVIVWGNSSEDDYTNEINNMVAENVVAFRIDRWLGKSDNVKNIIPDTAITDQIKNDYNLILVGCTESNEVLHYINNVLPIRMTESGFSIADVAFDEDDQGYNLRFPNPFNPNRYIWVVAANYPEALRFIPQQEDYVIYQTTQPAVTADRFLELCLGDFDNKWHLEEIAFVDNTKVDTGEDDPITVSEIVHYPPPDWSTQGVMYEIFVRSFFDSDGDGIGDIRGLIRKLDYLNDGDSDTDDDLGISVIWLMPVFESPSYHGYDVSDYYQINPDYGTKDDFFELVREAKKRGIKIVTDLVLNHCSSQHPYFQDAYGNPESPYSDWFYFTNESQTRAHNWYFRDNPYERGMLKPFMPALNVNNPEVQEYLIETAKYWLKPCEADDCNSGIDGFRLDYVKGPPHEFWQLFRQEIKKFKLDALLLAEAWTGMDEIALYFEDQFDMAFDFPFQGSLLAAITSGTSREFVSLVEYQQNILPQQAVMNRFINNHDMNRIFTQITDDQAYLALTILLTFPDMPMLYYGDELGMKGQKDPYDEGIRRPMQWYENHRGEGMTSWYPTWSETTAGISVQEQRDDPDSQLSLVRDLIRLRNTYPVLAEGKVDFHQTYTKHDDTMKEYRRAMAYTVSDDESEILLITNLHENERIGIRIESLDFSKLQQIYQIERNITDEYDYSITIETTDIGDFFIFSIPTRGAILFEIDK